MSKFTDQRYLVSQQYPNAQNLNSRISLHQRFSINPRDWFLWIFDHLLDFLPREAARLLEVGAGSAELWKRNLTRLPQGWRVTLSDLSNGMLQDARAALGTDAARFEFRTLDVQLLPYETPQFHAVLANHVLYHVPNVTRALQEIARVLLPGGRLFAATNGSTHMRDLDDLLMAYPPLAHIAPTMQQFANRHDTFNLENGMALLQPYFRSVTLHPYEDRLEVTEVEPLVAYALSMVGGLNVIEPTALEGFRAYLSQQMQSQGGKITIRKAIGLFVCEV